MRYGLPAAPPLPFYRAENIKNRFIKFEIILKIAEEMAKLTVTRPPEGMHDERKFRVMVNDFPAIVLKQKSSAEIEVPDKLFEMQVLSRQGRSRKVTIDPATTSSVELRINMKMHRYNPAMSLPAIVVFSVVAFINSESMIVRIVAGAAFMATAAWVFYALWVKREEWILIEPHR